MITCTVCGWTGCEHQLSFNCCPECDSEVEILTIEVPTIKKQAIKLLELVIEQLRSEKK